MHNNANWILPDDTLSNHTWLREQLLGNRIIVVSSGFFHNKFYQQTEMQQKLNIK